MKSSFVFFLLLCGTTVCHLRVYIYITENKTWFDAQKYCREHYVDLVTITTNEEYQGLKNAEGLTSNMDGWIGLMRIEAGSSIWKWSDGEPATFFHWERGQPDIPQLKENCGMVLKNSWHDVNCNIPKYFYCSWRYVLVKDSKTWQEALEYCRTYYTGLASPIYQEQLNLAESAIAQTQTVSMWAGLHFVNVKWVSVNSVPLTDLVSLPSCPAVRHRCGALNNKTHLWENRDCNEKLNFLCY